MKLSYFAAAVREDSKPDGGPKAVAKCTEMGKFPAPMHNRSFE
jgi:hypothetical protein